MVVDGAEMDMRGRCSAGQKVSLVSRKNNRKKPHKTEQGPTSLIPRRSVNSRKVFQPQSSLKNQAHKLRLVLQRPEKQKLTWKVFDNLYMMYGAYEQKLWSDDFTESLENTFKALAL